MSPATVLLSSSLRRTLVLPALCSAIIITCLIGCKNPTAEQKQILNDFDSINNRLKRIDTLVYSTDALYDSLMLKASDHSPTQQMYYHVNDFLNGYSSDLRNRLEAFAGERGMDSIELSALFFKDKRNDPGTFFKYLHDAAGRLKSFTKDSAKLEEIDDLIKLSPVEKAKALFTTVPPVAVITIIKSYQHKLMGMTVKVLEEYFKNC
ncbi:MAG: hypothetical protein JNM19_03415 [Chitinophagaceae bacterium]|nr:hypothetical protein [Chitinophagaceae bacterium]